MQFVSGRKRLDLTGKVAVVAVLNATPDSYVAGSRSLDISKLVAMAADAVRDGADIVEVGGESTGPGSRDVPVGEELRRVLPAVRSIRAVLPDTWISVDTAKSAVAVESLAAGADMINDVSAGRADPAMFGVVASAGCLYVLMYAKDSTTRTTRADTPYDDVVLTVRLFLETRIRAALDAGVRPSQLIIDPGLGHFLSSDPRYSREMILRLGELRDLGPLFVSPSRKSFLAGRLQLPVAERLPATLAASAVAVLHGAAFIRTHDVLGTREIVDATFRLMHAVR